jgi:putative membrane protein
MAWIRTAVAMIGFGFTIVQFFEGMRSMFEVASARFSSALRYLGLALIFCGVLALATSVWQYRWSLRYLWSESFSAIAGANNERIQTPLYTVATVLIFTGIAAFLAVLKRLP